MIALAGHATVEPVYNLEVESFHTYFVGRASDPVGKAAHIAFLEQGGSTPQLRAAMAGSKEGQDIITAAWKAKLGREPTAEERAQATEILRELGPLAVARAATDLRGNLMEAKLVAVHGTGFYEKFGKRPGTCSQCHTR